MKPSAFDSIQDLAEKTESLLCVGLDPSETSLRKFFEIHRNLKRSKSLANDAEIFCRYIIDETKDLVCCFKPNSAFFEALGPEGFQVLKNVCDYVYSLAIPIILDSKRGDIGSTAQAYAKAAFEIFHATIVTVNPYLGVDSLLPFIEPHPDKGIFVLCRTSNPGSKDLQEKLVFLEDPICTSNKSDDSLTPSCSTHSHSLYESVAEVCQSSDLLVRSAGLVVGATQPEAIRRIRTKFPDVWLLSPGIGAQRGDLKQCIQTGLRSDGYGLIIPISREIAENENPRQATEFFRDEINSNRIIHDRITNNPTNAKSIPIDSLV